MNNMEFIMKKIIFILPILLVLNAAHGAPLMSQLEMEKIVKQTASSSKGEKGVVKFIYNNVQMTLISDVKHDRMRIISAIKKFKALSTQQIEEILKSNFHKSLDARYAVSNNILYSAYIHPLSSLRKKQITSAMLQVSNLAKSFGHEYSSGMLRFGGDKKKENKKMKKGAI